MILPIHAVEVVSVESLTGKDAAERIVVKEAQMKKLIMLALMLMAGSVKASPYFYTPFTKGYQFEISNGALFDSQFNPVMDFTNIPLVYHPISSGSILPAVVQPYLPPESWSVDLGGGYAGNTAFGGIGLGINLLDSVRAYAAGLLALSSNASLNAAGRQIAPGNGPINIHVDYEPTAILFQNGQFARNPLKMTNHWFIGPSYAFSAGQTSNVNN